MTNNTGSSMLAGQAATSRDHTHAAMRVQAQNLRRDGIVLAVLAILAIASIAAYVCIGLTGNLEYVLKRRMNAVLALALVSIAIGVSTMLFQTVTANRLLTPSIMGFDSLYILVQTLFVVGTGVTGSTLLGTIGQFWLEVVLMIVFSVLLYSWLLRSQVQLQKLLLVGVVIGMLFRGISTFLQRLLDPDAFAVLQNTFFASFTDIDAELIPPAAVLTAIGIAIAWYDRRRLDVLSLGMPIATNLGINPRAIRIRILATVALLVSVSTALVGPITFFGLIVVHVAYRVMRVSRHALLLPAAAAIGLIALVFGQVLVERVFRLDITLSIVIEFVGGLFFIFLVLRRNTI